MDTVQHVCIPVSSIQPPASVKITQGMRVSYGPGVILTRLLHIHATLVKHHNLITNGLMHG